MKNERRRRRRRQETLFLSVMLGLLIVLMGLYVYLVSKEKGLTLGDTLSSLWYKPKPDPLVPSFAKGTQVSLNLSAQDQIGKKMFRDLKQQVGKVVDIEEVEIASKRQLVYTVKFSEDEYIGGLRESDLQQQITLFELGQRVGYVTGGSPDEEGRISAISLSEQDEGEFTYTVDYDTSETVTNLTDNDLIFIYDLPIKQNNSAEKNNQILREAMELSKGYAYTAIYFPEGEFKIGSQTPETDYLVLESNVELRGHETTLVIEGAARWFGLATGPLSTDGLSNFVMLDLTFRASDLSKGNQFIIMANHGYNWYIAGNRFELVHQISSHLFDLGGVQSAVFENNTFIGYAPELTKETRIGNRETHNFYSEAIQLDASDGTKAWDGGYLQKIDPNYAEFSRERYVSGNIRITNNQFLPYKDANGQIIAHSATIGQHSTEVGYVEIYNNQFESLLVKQVSPPEEEKWLFEAVHVPPSGDKVIDNNLVID